MLEINNGGQLFIGVVEDRNDSQQMGRVKVRVVGLHTHDTTKLPTSDLPWAMVMRPIGLNNTHPPKEGTTVVVLFNDWPECQMPIVIGSLHGVPQ